MASSEPYQGPGRALAMGDPVEHDGFDSGEPGRPHGDEAITLHAVFGMVGVEDEVGIEGPDTGRTRGGRRGPRPACPTTACEATAR